MKGALLAVASVLLVTVLALPGQAQARAAHRHRGRDRQCDDLTDEEKRVQLREVMRGELHESFYQYDGLRAALGEQLLESFQRDDQGDVAILRSPIDPRRHQRLNCSAMTEAVPQPGGNPTFGISPCPVSWLFNVDNHRYPRIMAEATCPNCSCMPQLQGLPSPSRVFSEPNRRSRQPQNNDDFSQCRPVPYYTRVLRKTRACGVNRKAIYVPVLEPIAMACSCRLRPFRVIPDAPKAPRIYSL